MKKIILLGMTVIMVVCLFFITGCQPSTGQNETDGKTDAEVTITVPDLITAASGVNRFTALRQQEFSEKYPNIKVNHIPPIAGDTSHMTEYITTAFMGENSPVCMSVSSLVYINDLYNQGMVADIKPYLSEKSDFYQTYDYVQKAFTRGDSVVGFPTALEVPLVGFFSDSLTANGYDAANFKCETWDDYYEVVKKINKDGCTGASLYLYEYFLWPHNWFLSNNAVPATQNSDGTITLDMGNEKMIHTLEYFRKLYGEKLTNQNISYSNIGDMMNLIYNKKIASFTFYPTWLSTLQPYGIKPSDITLIQFPKGPDAVKKQSSVIAAGIIFNARKSEKELQAAITYTEFMSGQDAYIAQTAFTKENDVVTFQLPPYPSIEWWDGMLNNGIPQNWIDATKESLEAACLMDLRSTAFTSYLTTQLPLLVTDSSRDIKSILEKAQKTATNEWLTEYNQNLK